MDQPGQLGLPGTTCPHIDRVYVDSRLPFLLVASWEKFQNTNKAGGWKTSTLQCNTFSRYRFHLVGQLTTGKQSAIVYTSIDRLIQFCGRQYWLQLTNKSQYIVSHKRVSTGTTKDSLIFLRNFYKEFRLLLALEAWHIL